MEQVYETVVKEYKEQFDLEVLKQMSFNNTFTLAVTQEMAEEYNLDKISDLAGIAGTLISGTTFEFSNREDGLSGLLKTYGFQMGKSLTLDAAPRYTALKNGEINVIDAFSTDGLLKKFNLKTLEDDKEFFPPYYAIPVIRADALEKYPEITGIMEELAPVLTNDVMIELNYKVDELQQSPADVARDFLKENGLISCPCFSYFPAGRQSVLQGCASHFHLKSNGLYFFPLGRIQHKKQARTLFPAKSRQSPILLHHYDFPLLPLWKPRKGFPVL